MKPTKETKNQDIENPTQNLTLAALCERYLHVRQRLDERRRSLQSQLLVVESVLKDFMSPEGQIAASASAPGDDSDFAIPRRKGELTRAIIAVLQQGPRTKDQILEQLRSDRVLAAGDGREVLDSVIYTKHFRRIGGKFSLASKHLQ